MDKFYHSCDFDFSPEAKQWILARYSSRFDQDFFHDFDITQLNTASQDDWQSSVVGGELNRYLATWGCDTRYYGIGVFVSNTGGRYWSNPHCDIRFKNGTQSEIKTRFNVMILGDSEDDMVWWPEFRYGDQRFVEQQFTALTGKQYTSRAVPGNTVAERWQWLGEPAVVEKNILTPSAFVRTDCVHAVILSPVPRLIVTVAIDRDLNELQPSNPNSPTLL